MLTNISKYVNIGYRILRKMFVMTESVDMARITFLQEHSLAKVQSVLDRASKKAVKLLQDTVDNTELDIKVRLGAAQKLIDLHVSVSDIVEKSNLQRTILEIKSQGGLLPSRQLPVQGDEDGTGEQPKALYNPDTVIRVGGNPLEEDVVDLSHVKEIE